MNDEREPGDEGMGTIQEAAGAPSERDQVRPA
jgi:hypothetical protein